MNTMNQELEPTSPSPLPPLHSQPKPPPTIFSLGYRCSSAGLLKRMGLKHESYPFDWMVSRLPIITHCNETNFKEFREETNYTNATAATYHYVVYPGQMLTPTPPTREQYICDEKFIYNTYYESYFNNEKSLLVPYPTSVPKDAYGYNMIMNHKNILQQENKEYYERCIGRWNQLMESPNEKIGIHIHPIMSHESYIYSKTPLRELITTFHQNMQTQTSNYKGLYIIPVRNLGPTPPYIERITHETHDNTFNLYILYTNEHFIDAGEIFMGHCEKETQILIDLIHYLSQQPYP